MAMMAICFSHLRRTLGSPARSKRLGTRKQALPTIAGSASVASSPDASPLPRRHFAAAAAKTKAKKTDAPDGLSYKARKAAAKQRRREVYEAHQARLARVKIRRDASPKDVKKKLFRSWWDNELAYHHTLCRVAKREKKP